MNAAETRQRPKGIVRRCLRWFIVVIVLTVAVVGGGWGYYEVLGRRFATGCTPVAETPSTFADMHAGLAKVLEEFSLSHDHLGVQAVVMEPDGGAFFGTAGYANHRRKCPVTEETLFCLGSASKLPTAAVIMSLAEEGALALEDRLGAWTGILPAGLEVSIEQLLRHTSGLPDYAESFRFRAAAVAIPWREWRPLDLAGLVGGKPLRSVPGSRYEYSDSNYLATALVAERAGGDSFKSLLRRRVVDPLNLVHFYFQPENLEGMPIARAYSDRIVGLGPRDVTAMRTVHLSGGYAAGGMVANARELARFTAALFGGVLLDEETVARMAAFREVSDMRQPAVTGYGLGVQRMEVKGRELWGHIGTGPGFSAFAAFSPEHGHVITILANQAGVDLPELAGELHRQALIASGIEPRF